MSRTRRTAPVPPVARIWRAWVRRGTADDAALDGRLEAVLEPYVHPHVLVIDELGYQSYAADAANVLFRVVSIRHLKRRSTIVTTNKPGGARPGAA